MHDPIHLQKTFAKSPILLFAIFVVLVITSTSFAYLKYQALSYDTIDYPFYAQFSARLLNKSLSNTFVAQPEGFNMLGYVGIEAKHSFHQSLHIEPIKYFFALLFFLFPFPITLFTLTSCIYFSPFLYLAFLQKRNIVQSYYAPLVILLFYSLYPSALNTVTYDLRPRIFLSTFLLLGFFAVLYQRPSTEKFVLLFSIALIREEALLFIAVLIATNFFLLPNRRKAIQESIVFISAWAIYALIILEYFSWTGYEVDHVLNPLQKTLGNPSFLTTLLLLMILWSVLLKKSRQKEIPIRKFISLTAFSSLLLPLGIQLPQEVSKWKLAPEGLPLTAIKRILLSPKMNIYIVVLLLLFFFIWQTWGKPQFSIFLRRSGNVVFLILLSISLHQAVIKSINYLNIKKDTTIVFDFIDTASLHTTHILTDESTYQAFFQFENITLYERLPWDVGQENRYYPDNTPLLEEILQNINYVVISQQSADIIHSLLKDSGVEYQILDQNSAYLIISTN